MHRYLILATGGGFHTGTRFFRDANLRKQPHDERVQPRQSGPDRLDGQLFATPPICREQDGGTVYEWNHTALHNAEFRQHGGRGQIAVRTWKGPRPGERQDRKCAPESPGLGAFGQWALFGGMLIIANAETI